MAPISLQRRERRCRRRSQSTVQTLLLLVSSFLLLLGESQGDRSGDGPEELRMLQQNNFMTLRDYESIHPEPSSSPSSIIPDELRSVLGMLQDNSTMDNEISVEMLWESQQKSVWHDACKAETVYGKSSSGNGRFLAGVDSYFPFIFCSFGKTQSGRKRRANIESLLRTVSRNNQTSQRIMRAVFSDDSMSCFVSVATASEAGALVSNDNGSHGEEIVVAPMTPLMKIPDWVYTVEAIRNQIKEQMQESERGNQGRAGKGKKGRDDDSDPSVTLIRIEIEVELSSFFESNDIPTYAEGLVEYAKARVNAVIYRSPKKTNVFNHVNGGSRHLRKGSTENSDDGQQTAFSISCHDIVPSINYVFPESNSFSLVLVNGGSSELISQEKCLKCALAYMAALSTHRGIYSVSADTIPQTSNDMAQWILQGRDLSLLSAKPMPKPHRPYFDAGLTAANQIVGLSDTGIDEDSCYFHDKSGGVERWKYFPGQDVDGVPRDMKKRKIAMYYMHPNAEAGDAFTGHGTHVAGTLAGRRSTDGDTVEDERGYGDGIALNAKIAFLDIGRSDGSLRAWKNEHLFLPAVSAGAKVHSISWGYTSSGYNTLTRNIDHFLYQNEDMLVIVAAGNHGSNGASSLVMPATAKNIISVGASHSDGPDIGSGEAGFEYVASYSSRGPASGLRAKPDVVAPGHRLLSADGRLGSTGVCDKKGVSREDYLYGDDGSFGLRYATGTSMAAPVVAGMALQIRQYFIDGYYPYGRKGTGHSFNPSGSLVKAVIMNGAQFLLGVASSSKIEAVRPFDNVQNFGRVSLYHSLPLQGENELQMTVHDRVLIGDGDFHEYEVVLYGSPNSACPFSTTLVWADEPGETLLNDLDLTVIRSGKSYFANGLDRPDRANNAERVLIYGTGGGEHIGVRVDSHNLQVDSLKYSLVITHCGGEDQSPTHNPSPQPSKAPTKVPSKNTVSAKAPTNAPTNLSDTNGELVRKEIAPNSVRPILQYGCFFDIEAFSAVALNGVEVNIDARGPVSVEILTIRKSIGSSKNVLRKKDDWTKIGSISTEGRGVGKGTKVMFPEPQQLSPREKIGVYVSVATKDASLGAIRSDQKFLEMIKSDENGDNHLLEISVGYCTKEVDKGNKFGKGTKQMVMDGALFYKRRR